MNGLVLGFYSQFLIGLAQLCQYLSLIQFWPCLFILFPYWRSLRFGLWGWTLAMNGSTLMAFDRTWYDLDWGFRATFKICWFGSSSKNIRSNWQRDLSWSNWLETFGLSSLIRCPTFNPVHCLSNVNRMLLPRKFSPLLLNIYMVQVDLYGLACGDGPTPSELITRGRRDRKVSSISSYNSAGWTMGVCGSACFESSM